MPGACPANLISHVTHLTNAVLLHPTAFRQPQARRSRDVARGWGRPRAILGLRGGPGGGSWHPPAVGDSCFRLSPHPRALSEGCCSNRLILAKPVDGCALTTATGRAVSWLPEGGPRQRHSLGLEASSPMRVSRGPRDRGVGRRSRQPAGPAGEGCLQSGPNPHPRETQ